MATPIIEVRNLIKTFKIEKCYIRALRGVNFSLYPGEFLIIYGPSGCGKSTLLNMLAGLDDYTNGKIYFNGRELSQYQKQELTKYNRQNLGMVFQNYNLIPSISVLENVALPLNFSGVKKKERIRRAKEVIGAVKLSDKMKRYPSELSGGEQQRVSIARAVVYNPGILLVDEPTGNLDEQSGWEAVSLLASLCRKYHRTVLLVTHNSAFFSLADRILYMRNGVIEKEDTVPDKMKIHNVFSGAPVLSNYSPSKYKNNMRLKDMISLAYKHFRYAKSRTFWTILGITIGIAAIILLVSLGFGLQGIATSRLADFDTLQTVSVTEGTQGPKLNDAQIEKIKNLDQVALVSPSITAIASGTLSSTTTSVTVAGYLPSYLEFEQVNLDTGRTFTSDDANEAIVSQTAIKAFDISGSSSLLDKKMTLNIISEDLKSQNLEMTIVGITGEKQLPIVFVPLNTLKKISPDSYSLINVKVKDRKEIERTAEEIDKLGFNTSSTSSLIDQVDKAFLLIEILLGAIGGIAFFVASFGIINTMTISLLERTHEIGIMKALGISSKDIRRLFVNEAGFFGLFGGIFGILTGYAAGQFFNGVVYVLMQKSGESEALVPFVTPWKFAVVILLFSYIIARFAGFYPAWHASKLSPIEALRHG